MLKLKMALILAVFFMASCKQQEEVRPAPEASVEEFANFDGKELTYHYQGKTYSGQVWEKKYAHLHRSYNVQVEDEVHVFDSAEESDAYLEKLNTSKSIAKPGWGFHMRVYAGPNYTTKQPYKDIIVRDRPAHAVNWTFGFGSFWSANIESLRIYNNQHLNFLSHGVIDFHFFENHNLSGHLFKATLWLDTHFHKPYSTNLGPSKNRIRSISARAFGDDEGALR